MRSKAASRAQTAWCCLSLCGLGTGCEYCGPCAGSSYQWEHTGYGARGIGGGDACDAVFFLAVVGGIWVVSEIVKGIERAFDARDNGPRHGVAWDSPEGIALRGGPGAH
jgi:hypothetical protein